MSSVKPKFDLYTFIAGAALEKGEPFPLECNCSGVVTIMPPFQDEFVVCPRCESRIRMLVIEGDPCKAVPVCIPANSHQKNERKS